MKNLKEIRTKKGFTQLDLAAAVGVSLTTIRNWEYGASTPNEENEKKLMEVLEENK